MLRLLHGLFLLGAGFPLSRIGRGIWRGRVGIWRGRMRIWRGRVRIRRRRVGIRRGSRRRRPGPGTGSRGE